jgi:PAS domain S-box-containing protein
MQRNDTEETSMTRLDTARKAPPPPVTGFAGAQSKKPKLFDTSIIGNPQAAMDFITNILESSTEYSIIAKDLTGNILLWNEGARRLYGYEPEEVVGKMNSSILHTPEDVSAGLPAKIMADVLQHGKFEGTVSRRRRNGEEFTARLVITPRRDAAGKAIGFLLISKDISDEIRMAQYARSLIEASLDPLVTISGDGKITDVNEATTKVTGVPRNELIGTDFSNYFTEPEKAQEGYRQVFAKGMVTDYPLTIRHAEGGLTDVLYNASVYRDERGAVIGVFAAARDVTAQKQASEYARSLIEASLDPLVTISADGKITDVNEATAKVTGVPREELIGADFSNYFTEPDKAQEGYRQVFAQGMVTDYPLTIRHADGRLTDVLYNASVYRDERGNVLGIFAAARDVTGRKKAEEKFRSLLEAAPDSIVIVNKDGRIVLVNAQTQKLFGYEREELLDQPVEILVPQRFRGAHPGHRTGFFAKPAARAMGAGLELFGQRKDGSEFQVEISLSPLETEEGILVSSAIRDVTAQKLASQYARSLIEASLDPLVTISGDGKITDVNEATAKVTGVSRDKLIGTDFSNYFTEPERSQEGYRQVFAKGMVTDYPLTIRHVGGRLTDVLYNASVYRDARGNVLGVFAAARDVTAQKQAEAQLADQRAKELERLAELERFQKLTMGRELRMIELKKEIEDLKKKVA